MNYLNSIKKFFLSFFLIFIIFISDRISKNKIIQISENKNSIYINDFLNFDLVFNTGIAFGIFSSQNDLVYNAITFLISAIIVFIVYLILTSHNIDKILYSCIAGGALGNLYDRIFFRAVPDFIDFHINDYHWFSFNLADIFISLGIIMILIKELFNKNNEI